MTIHEFGKGNEKVIVLIHPSLVMWDYFEYVIPLLEQDFHLVVPALPGYDKERQSDDYTSVEAIAAELEAWLLERKLDRVCCIYGCSMGGSVATKLLTSEKLQFDSAVIDGGITPYKLPRLITKLIAIKDFCLIYMGKIGGAALLEKAFATDDYSKEDLEYIADMFKWISARTIWNTFYSCNNYDMPAMVSTSCEHIEYWYGDAEERERKKDLRYFRENFPNTEFCRIEGLGHGGMATLHPQEFADKIKLSIEKAVSN